MIKGKKMQRIIYKKKEWRRGDGESKSSGEKYKRGQTQERKRSSGEKNAIENYAQVECDKK